MIRLISFEGGDGSGKTTQVASLQTHLSRKGNSCISTREPGGTALGEILRRALLDVGEREISGAAELFLYLADRSEHVKEVIEPALAAGQLVLCDRFSDSTLAYQGYGRGFDLSLLRSLNRVATAGIEPDLTLLLDLPVAVGLSRTRRRLRRDGSIGGEVAGKPEDRFEREELEFHERVRKGFLALARSEPDRITVVDASLPVADVQRQIREIVDRELAGE
jgi:dTMP kinase